MATGVPPIRPPKKERQQHLEQARHNEAHLAKSLMDSPNQFDDWKVTTCFYIGLHWVRLFLHTKGVFNSGSHQDTLDCINPNVVKKPAIYTPIKELYEPYFALKQMSENARYDGFLQAGTFNALQKNNLVKAQACVKQIKDVLFARGIKEAGPGVQPTPTPEGPAS